MLSGNSRRGCKPCDTTQTPPSGSGTGPCRLTRKDLPCSARLRQRCLHPASSVSDSSARILTVCFSASQLRGKRRVENLQVAWLLLHYCACPRAYLLRALPLGATAVYASPHDDTITRCLSMFLSVADAPLPSRTARLAIRFGGLGLRAAGADRHAAYWASWMGDCAMLWSFSCSLPLNLLAAVVLEAVGW